MDIINNRYRITEKLESSVPNVEEFLAKDLWNKGRLLSLKIFSESDISADTLTFFKDEFIIISSLDNRFHLKNYGFESLSSSLSYHIQDGNGGKFYVCTTEYISDKMTVSEYIKKCPFSDILQIAVQICQALTYAGNIGFRYDSLPLNDIFITPYRNTFKVRIKDIAASKMENPFSVYLVETENYIEANDNAETAGGLIISLLAGKSVTANFKPALTSLKRVYNKKRLKKGDTEIFNCLYEAVKQAVNYNKKNEKCAVYDIVNIINSRLKTDYPACAVEPLKSLTFYPRIVGRGPFLQSVMSALQEIRAGSGALNVVLVKGIAGVGKTRFIREADYFLSLESINIYSNYGFKKTADGNMLDTVLTDIFSNFSSAAVKSGEKTAKQTELFRSGGSRSKRINRQDNSYNSKEIRNLFFEAAKTNPCFIIIDDIHLADDSVLDLFLYLALEIVYIGKLGIIFSYDESTPPKSPNFEAFLKKLYRKPNVKTIGLTNLSEEETDAMIKNILLIKYIPAGFGAFIYKQTLGNPFFIIEIIKDFIGQGFIYKEKNSGMWGIADNFYENNTGEKISVNIQQTVQNQIQNLSGMEKDILTVIALFRQTFKQEHIRKFFKLPAAETACLLNDFLIKGIISEVKYADNIEYAIGNKVLQEVICNKCSEKQKKAIHTKIAKILQKEYPVNRDELVWHLENSNKRKEAIRYYMKTASHNTRRKLITKAVLQYEKALALISPQDIEMRCFLLLKILQLYNKIDARQKRIDTIHSVSLIIDAVNSRGLLSLYYYFSAKLAYDEENTDKVLFYLNKQKDIYADKKAKVIYLRILLTDCFYSRLKYEYEKLLKNAFAIIRLAGEERRYIPYKTKAFILSGYVYYNMQDHYKAFKFFKRGRILSDMISNIYDECDALYNILLIHLNIYGYNDRTLPYTRKLLAKIRKSGIGSIEVPLLINYAKILTEKQKHLSAYECVKQGEQRIEEYKLVKFKLINIIAMIGVLKNLNEYGKMFEYANLMKTILKKEETETVHFYSAALYSILADAYQELNCNEKAYELLLKLRELENFVDGLNCSLLNFRMSAYCLIQKKTASLDAILKDFEEFTAQYDNTDNFFDKGTMYKFLLNTAVVLTLRRPDIDFTPLFQNMLLHADQDSYPGQQAYLFYLTSYINKSDEKECLLKAISVIKSSRVLYFLALLYIRLGLSYLKDGSINFAVMSFLEAQNIIIERIKKTPKEYKNNILNDSFYALPFAIVEDFINKKNIADHDKMISDICLLEPETNVKIAHLQFLKKDKTFKNNVVEDILEKTGFAEKIKNDSILQKMGLDYYDDMKTVMEFLTINIIAQHYQIFIIDKKNEPVPIFPLDGANKYFSYIEEAFTKFGFDNISKIEAGSKTPCMIVPIKVTDTGYGRNTLLGFMVFVAENIINNISPEGRKLCEKYSTFLAMLIESNKVKQAASIDDLTGALTRKYLEISLKKLFKNSTQNNSAFSIILYDLDKFKNINDTYGHHTGDIVLKSVTQTVLKSLKQPRFVGRYGGEEFIIALPGHDERAAAAAAEFFRSKVEKQVIGKLKLKVTISLGIASYPKHGSAVNDLILNADTALYKAKKEGRNRAYVWSPEYASDTKNLGTIRGIVITDETRYSENVSSLSDVLNLSQKNLTRKEFLSAYSAKLIKIFEAENIAVILANKNGKEFVTAYKAGFKRYKINETFVKSVMEKGMGIRQIDWENTAGKHAITGLPEWNSVMVVPFIKNGAIIGLIYITVPEKKHEFDSEDLNFLETLADIAAANL